MPREIKFRYVFQHGDTGYIAIKHFALIEIETGATKQLSLRWFPIARNQYTGVLDKNGKEIYEGDIVKYGDTYGTIRWSIDGARFYVSAPAQNTTFNNAIWNMNLRWELLEIIGNIYEHDYLLDRTGEQKSSPVHQPICPKGGGGFVMKARLIRIKMDELLTELAEVESLLLSCEEGASQFDFKLQKAHLSGEIKSLEWMLTEEKLELDWANTFVPLKQTLTGENK